MILLQHLGKHHMFDATHGMWGMHWFWWIFWVLAMVGVVWIINRTQQGRSEALPASQRK
jgi:putative membrane protein